MPEPKIVSMNVAPDSGRHMFTMEGTEEALQGVRDWAEGTWGSRNCQGYSRKRQLNPRRAAKPRIFLFNRKTFVFVALGGAITPSIYSQRFAIWGPGNATLFKLKWA